LEKGWWQAALLALGPHVDSAGRARRWGTAHAD
jgi:hypothetical protein